MKKFLHRTLALVLTLALMLSVTIPALAVKVPVTGVSLDQTALTLIPGQTYTLKAQVSPQDADNQDVTWSSNKTSVAQVDRNGKVTAVAEGTAAITVKTSDGSWPAICTITVEKRAAVAVAIVPAGPENLPVGTTRQLVAAVAYNHGESSHDVTWSSSDTKVVTVTADGKITAVAEGKASIVAQSKDLSKEGTPCSAVYEVTVTQADPDAANHKLTLSATKAEGQCGLLQSRTLSAPDILIQSGDKDVSDQYAVTYAWTTGQETLEGETAVVVTPVTQGDLVVTCTVTAVSKTDSTRVLTDTCTYTLKVLPGTALGAEVSLTDGVLALGELESVEGQTLMDQLTNGVQDDPMTPAIPGLTHVVFDLDSVSGAEFGTLDVQEGASYYLVGEQNLLAGVTFTPAAQGTYAIGFTAYGTETYYGQLEILVTAGDTPDDPVLPPEDSILCDSTGFTFSVSDFYHADAEDPIVSVRFGTPSAGKLLRNFIKGSGVTDTGAVYYTLDAKDGDYHISTLSYLPPVGFSGVVTIPVTMTAQGGHVHQELLTAGVTSTDTSKYFTDVTPATVGVWAANSVDFAYECELVNGIGNGLFGPYSPMTRGMLVTVLYRAAGSPSAAVTTNFTDLDPTAYYYEPVLWATVNGIVNGTTANTFSPDAPLTREQLAAILYRYAETMGVSTQVSGTLTGYTDQGMISPYARQAMSWAVSQGIISGTTPTTLDPQGSATRAQVAVILHRYLIGQ